MKDLNFQQLTHSGGFSNTEQQTTNLATKTIDKQAASINSANTLVQHSNTLCTNYAKQVDKLEAQVRRGGDNGGSGGGYDSGRLPKFTFAQFIQIVDNKLHYCHSCGLCNHKISAYRLSTRKPWHKVEATVTNRLGRSMAVLAALSALGLKMK